MSARKRSRKDYAVAPPGIPANIIVILIPLNHSALEPECCDNDPGQHHHPDQNPVVPLLVALGDLPGQARKAGFVFGLLRVRPRTIESEIVEYLMERLLSSWPAGNWRSRWMPGRRDWWETSRTAAVSGGPRADPRRSMSMTSRTGSSARRCLTGCHYRTVDAEIIGEFRGAFRRFSSVGVRQCLA